MFSLYFSFTPFQLVNKCICKHLVGDEEQSCGSVMEVGNGKLDVFAFIYTRSFFVVVSPGATFGPSRSSAAELLGVIFVMENRIFCFSQHIFTLTLLHFLLLNDPQNSSEMKKNPNTFH